MAVTERAWKSAGNNQQCKYGLQFRIWFQSVEGISNYFPSRSGNRMRIWNAYWPHPVAQGAFHSRVAEYSNRSGVTVECILAPQGAFHSRISEYSNRSGVMVETSWPLRAHFTRKLLSISIDLKSRWSASRLLRAHFNLRPHRTTPSHSEPQRATTNLCEPQETAVNHREPQRAIGRHRKYPQYDTQEQCNKCVSGTS